MCDRLQMGTAGTGSARENYPCFVPLHGRIAPPLDASYYKGCGERAGIEREIIAVRVKDKMKDKNYPCFTLKIRGGGATRTSNLTVQSVRLEKVR